MSDKSERWFFHVAKNLRTAKKYYVKLARARTLQIHSIIWFRRCVHDGVHKLQANYVCIGSIHSLST